MLVVSRSREYILFIFVERKQRKLKEMKIVVVANFFFLKHNKAYSGADRRGDMTCPRYAAP